MLAYKLKKALRLDVSRYGSTDYLALEGVDKKTFVNIVNERLDKYLGLIDKPTLIIWGEKDVDTPMYMANILRRRIKNSGLVVLEGEGHFGYIYQADRVRRIIKSFVRG